MKYPNKNHFVVKSNKLIEAKYKLTLNEQRLILLLISQINMKDEEFKDYVIKVSDLMDLFGLNNKNHYNIIKEVTLNLLSKPLSIPRETGVLHCNWISSAEYFENEGCVKLCFDPKLKPYLLQLKNHFTTYGLDNVIRLKSTYAIRLYEILLKEYCYYSKKRINFIFSIKELKELLGIEKKEYPLFANFKVKVLNIAERELKAKSDFYFEYKTIKTGRAITDIEFTVIEKEKKQKQLTTKDDSQNVLDVKSSPLEEKIETDDINKRLIELGFQDYKKIRSDHSDEVILDAFSDLDFEIADRKKKNKESLQNIGAWVRKRLPASGQPFQKSPHHTQYLQEEETRKKCEEIKLQEELKAKQEREKQERFLKELDEKINKKIEDLQLNSPEEWEAVEKEVGKRVNSELKPPKQDKEEKAIVKQIISDLTDKDKKMLELEALEKAKTSLIGLGLTEDSKNFQTALNSVKTSVFESIIKERYTSEIQSLLKETKYYKSYEKRVIIESNKVRRGIIIDKYLRNPQT